MSAQGKLVIRMSIPSTLGCEQVAMDVTAATARKMGLSKARIEDLRTVVSKACTNAIRHGHSFDAQSRVSVVLTIRGDSVSVNIIDNCHKSIPDPLPDRSARNGHRGLGLYLMGALTDEMMLESQPDRNEVNMINYL